jgi:DNA-binding NarL/FixJ family response regulator
VDDQPEGREGWSLLLANKGLVICGEAGQRGEALPLLASAAADIVLVDLSLGEESGIDLIAVLRERGMKTLVYSMHDDGEWVETALAAGANGYVTKREVAATLLEAIGRILAGGCYTSPIAAEAVRQQAVTGEGRVMVERLSERELELFRKMGEGYSTADLARHFDISPSTVETYYARIMEKLDLTGTKELRFRAIRCMKGR